jgi:hypothetical protein
VRWHRKGFRLYWGWISKRAPGRPAITEEARELIRRFALENGTTACWWPSASLRLARGGVVARRQNTPVVLVAPNEFRAPTALRRPSQARRRKYASLLASLACCQRGGRRLPLPARS